MEFENGHFVLSERDIAARPGVPEIFPYEDADKYKRELLHKAKKVSDMAARYQMSPIHRDKGQHSELVARACILVTMSEEIQQEVRVQEGMADVMTGFEELLNKQS